MANRVDSSLPFTNDSFTNVNTTKENANVLMRKETKYIQNNKLTDRKLNKKDKE